MRKIRGRRGGATQAYLLWYVEEPPTKSTKEISIIFAEVDKMNTKVREEIIACAAALSLAIGKGVAAWWTGALA
ncbi:MAG: hypothetical protein HY539_05825, partial [Deltaproteobacteria bacterium]|nr:hypothetical protein [Deltaproteobacteria bacterium]